mmetsp:Transcript_8220/g.17744  ORF Transcript_8220/g.17744 Transcript_8220/m.17744 type:complete len:83 (+) Transcript_8220:495-743(+)
MPPIYTGMCRYVCMLRDTDNERSKKSLQAIHRKKSDTRFVPTDRLLFGRNKRMIGWFSSKWISGKQSKTSKKLTNPALVWFH